MSRKVKPRAADRREFDRRADSGGYPPLFLGKGIKTRVLTEIAANELATVYELPVSATINNSTMTSNVARLVAEGLVRRWKTGGYPPLYHMTLDTRHPHWRPIRDVLIAIGAARGISIPFEPKIVPAEYVPVTEREGQRSLRRRFVSRSEPIEMLFGSPNRTRAILLVGMVGAVDATTLGRVIGVGQACPGNLTSLLRPIEEDDVFACEVTGHFNKYRLTEQPWTSALKSLVQDIVNRDPVRSTVYEAAKKMLVTGTLRRHRYNDVGVIRV